MPKKTKKIAAGQASLSSKARVVPALQGGRFRVQGREQPIGSVNPETLSNDKLVKMGLIDLT